MSLLRLQQTFNVRGDLHHACLLFGERSFVTASLLQFLEEALEISALGNPDFHHFEYDSFGIDDGRKLQEYAIQKPVGEYKIFIAAFATMTKEAQNALLKLFEDPKDNTHFFLITESESTMLPTLRSRLFLVDLRGGEEENFDDDAKKFIAISKTERIAYLSDLIENKDKSAVYNFLGALEKKLYELSKKKTANEDAILGLSEVEKSKQYVFDRSSSLKLLLEHVALTIPKM